MKRVAAAIIQHNDRVLVAQRAAGQKQAGKWEFPGGKIEPGETPQQCLIREIDEELSLVISVESFVGVSQFSYDHGTIELEGWLATFVSGTPTLSVHSEIRLVLPEDLLKLDLAPADIPLVHALLTRIKNETAPRNSEQLT